MTVEERVGESLGIMHKVLPVESFSERYPLIVNFSGGKDSMTCLLLARMITPHVQCFYMDAGFELPETLPYVRSQAKAMGVRLHVSSPTKDRVHHRTIPPYICQLHQYVEYFGQWPSPMQRWCSIWCKQRPGKVYLRRTFGELPLMKLVGVKATDSKRRAYVYGAPGAAKYGGLHRRRDMEMSPTYLVYPILKWTGDECMQFIEEQGFKVHSGYKRFGVSGCAWCPVHKPETTYKISRVHAHIYDRLIMAERAIGRPAWTHRKVWLEDVVKGNLEPRGEP